MRTSRLITTLLGNFTALIIADRFISGFSIVHTWSAFAILVVALLLLNTVIGPFLRLLLSPLILFTLGIAALAVNAFLLAILDFFFQSLTIEGLKPLLLATLIVALMNLMIHTGVHRLSKPQ